MPDRIALYVRVSKHDVQTTANQITRLKNYAVFKGYTLSEENIYQDIITGISPNEERLGLTRLLNNLDLYDGVLVTKIDRIGRSFGDVINNVIFLCDKKGKFFETADQNIRISSSPKDIIGRAFLYMMAIFAEIERVFIQERTQAAMDRIKDEIKTNGIYVTKKGRKIDHLGMDKLNINTQEIIALRKKGIGIRGIAEQLHTSRGTIERRLKELGMR